MGVVVVVVGVVVVGVVVVGVVVTVVVVAVVVVGVVVVGVVVTVVVVGVVVTVVVVGVVVTVVVVGVVVVGVVVVVVDVFRRRRRSRIWRTEAAWADGRRLVTCLRRAVLARRGWFAAVSTAAVRAAFVVGWPWVVTASAAAGPQQAATSAATTGRSLQERMHLASVSGDAFASHRPQAGHVSDCGSGRGPDGRWTFVRASRLSVRYVDESCAECGVANSSGEARNQRLARSTLRRNLRRPSSW